MTANFYMGVLLPLAVLSCYGTSAILGPLPKRRRLLVVLLLVGLVSFEYYQPVRQGVIAELELAFLDWLDEEPVEVRLINLPMGGWNTMLYGFYQTQNGYPQAEGRAARTPPSSYNYISANNLLNTWRRRSTAHCTWRTQDEYLAALDELESTGFTHVVFHRDLPTASQIADSFVGASASFEDEYVSIYRLYDLRSFCMRDFAAEFATASPYVDIYLMPSILSRRHGLAMSFHQTQAADEEFLQYFSHISFDQKSVVHISSADPDETLAQSSDEMRTDLDNIAEVDNGVWLINNPRETDLELLGVYRDWFKQNYKFCSRFVDQDDATIDLYLKTDIPCEAAGESSAFQVDYDNGVSIQNLSFQRLSDRHVFYIAWAKESARDYAFSIQFFDEQSQKVFQYDNTIFEELMSVYELDTSKVPAGSYAMKLIVYDYETGVSQSGTMEELQQRFVRDLEIANIELK